MDNRPIGFFDSGLGGLTCIPHLLRDFPNERVVYFGDTARTPYGSKAPSTILKFATEVAEKPPYAVQFIKHAVDRGYDTTLEQGLELESSLYGQIFSTEDAKEGFKAFMEKRPPKFTGK